MKKLFPLQTFQQDAVLKRLSELSEIVPESLESDAGKVIMVGEDGNYTLGQPSGGTKLYRHHVKGTIIDGPKTYNVQAYIISNQEDAFEADDTNVFYNCICIKEMLAKKDDEEYILVSDCSNFSDILWLLDTDDTTFIMLSIADGFTTITSDDVYEL